MSNCSWNCQLAVGDNQPIPHALAVIVGRLVGYDVADRRAGGSHDSIPFFSSDKRRIARQFQDLSRASNVRFVAVGSIGRCNTSIKSRSALGFEAQSLAQLFIELPSHSV
jgi:hypothetical protein